MLKDEYHQQLIKSISLQILIKLLENMAGLDTEYIQNEIKQFIFNKYRVKSQYYLRSINCFLAAVKNISFKNQGHQQIINYYQQKLHAHISKINVETIDELRKYIGYPLLLQITCLLNKGHSLYPHSTTLLSLLNCSCCLEEYSKINCISKICLANPNYIIRLFKKAQGLYLNKEFDQALHLASTGIKVCNILDMAAFNEVHSQLSFLKGSILHCKQKWKSSAISYVGAVQKNPQNLTFRMAAVESCLISGNYQDARVLIGNFQKQNPKSILFIAIYGAVLALQQKYQRAREKFNEIKKIVEKDNSLQTQMAHYYLSVGIFHFQMMEYQQCLRNLQIAQKSNKNNLFILKWIADCNYRLQNYKLALRYYQQVEKFLKNHQQQIKNNLQIGVVYLALLRKDYGYYSNIRQIIKKVQLGSRCKKLNSQSFLLLLQLCRSLKQLKKMKVLISKYPQIYPIFSLQDSRANIFSLEYYSSIKKLNYVSKIYYAILQHIQNTDGEIFERFQQICFLIQHHYLADIHQRRQIKDSLESIGGKIIQYVEKFSDEGAKRLKKQLNKIEAFDFLLTMSSK